MAAAYVQIAPGSATDGDTKTSLRTLTNTLFAPYRQSAPDRIVVRTEDFDLPSDAAASLALILHELATNSAKYGALAAGGRICLDVRREAGAISFDWQETGGEPQAEAPSRAGFGSQLIRASVANLSGEIETAWGTSGLHWQMHVPDYVLADR